MVPARVQPLVQSELETKATPAPDAGLAQPAQKLRSHKSNKAPGKVTVQTSPRVDDSPIVHLQAFAQPGNTTADTVVQHSPLDISPSSPQNTNQSDAVTTPNMEELLDQLPEQLALCLFVVMMYSAGTVL